MPENLDLLVSAVALARQQAAESGEAIRLKREAFEASIDPQLVEDAQNQQRLAAAEAALRETALGMYRADPSSKRLHPAIGIRVSRKVKYDPEEAIDWVIEHAMLNLLKLDIRAFDKLLGTGVVDALDIVEQEIPTATIATDLSEYLP